ncbi:hypothetical protein [Clostridium butyricum]|uniref:hypothetical protein n=2 Tax=Clostridium butyricum TaxID=1492 RepID=UPI00325B1F6E
MLMRKTLACLLIPTLLTIANTSKANALSTDVEEKVELINIKNGYDKLQEGIQRRKEIEEKVNKRIDNIIARKEKEEQERIERENSYDIELVFSFYTNLSEENGGYEGITCTGEQLQYGHLASNVWGLGTKFETENGEIFTVADRGGSHFNSYNRVDCYIPRNQGESVNQYKKRVLNMGRKTIKVKLMP